jgi:hypothetical protein
MQLYGSIESKGGPTTIRRPRTPSKRRSGNCDSVVTSFVGISELLWSSVRTNRRLLSARLDASWIVHEPEHVLQGCQR